MFINRQPVQFGYTIDYDRIFMTYFSTKSRVRELTAELFYLKSGDISEIAYVHNAFLFFTTYNESLDQMQMFVDEFFKYKEFSNWYTLLFDLLKSQLSNGIMAVTIAAAIVCTTHRDLQEVHTEGT